MPKYIKKKDLKNAIDECTWYHIGKNGELVEGANSSEHEPLYKYSDIKDIIKNLPTRKFETEPKRTALSKALKWTYGDEPNSSEKPNNCETCRHYTLACDLFSEICRYEPKTEPQTVDMFALDMAIAKCKVRHNNCKNCDKKCVWRNYPYERMQGLSDNIKAIKDLQEHYGIKQEPTLSEIMNEKDGK